MDLPSVTPPLVSPEDEEDESLEDSYFQRPYVPLSNLPTPPPCRLTAAMPLCSPERILSESPDSVLIGPAIHLCNLIPTASSLLDPSVRIVHDLLVRGRIHIDTIALAVCILDSLNSRFALRWRGSFPLAASNSATGRASHIDCVRPEVIVLAALMVALKFAEDECRSTQACARGWARGRWTCQQINVTHQCIVENLGYRIHPLWTKELIMEAIEDMEMAGKYAKLPQDALVDITQSRISQLGKGTQSEEWSVTPMESSVDENDLVPSLDAINARLTHLDDLVDAASDPDGLDPYPIFRY